jgi:protein-tyrosine-phosphatase
LKKKILFVCTGNTCRSPLAAALAASALQESKITDWLVDSAGLAAHAGSPASSGSQKTATELGLDLSTHAAKPLTPELLASADLVLTMTASHKAVLTRVAPHHADKIFSITEFLGEDGEVPDPYGGSLLVYRQTARRLNAFVSLLAEKLKEY